jgi:hypothetical protein
MHRPRSIRGAAGVGIEPVETCPSPGGLFSLPAGYCFGEAGRHGEPFGENVGDRCRLRRD